MKISYILDSVDSGTVVLPEFQRGYVWSRDQVKGLIQSLYQRFPVGGLLIWNTRADTTDLRGSAASGADTVKLLLDGQQRVTSLYGVLRGKTPQFFEDPERAKAFTGLYFHLELETFEFYRPSKMAGEPLWISVTDLMLRGPEDLTESLGEIGSMDAKRLVLFVNRLQRLHGVRDIDLHDENLSGDQMTVDVVVDIFNRVNSGGTKLSKGDLALARICALRPAARDELRGAIARWGAAGFNFTLDWFLRCVNVVVTGEAKFEALKSVSGEDFGVGLKKAEKAIDFILNLLGTRLGLDHDRVLMGRYGIPALVRIMVDHGGAVTDVQQQNNVLFWYVHQAAWGRYGGSTESVLDRDLAAIDEGGIEGLIHELEFWRGSLTVRPDDFDTQSVGSRFYPVLYMLTRVNDAKDFCSGLPLSAHLLGKGSSLEVHHLFPKAVLYKAGYSRKQVNAVANFAFLTGDCNRKLGMREPAGYFPEVAAGHQGALTSQWIADDKTLWQVENYLKFLSDRRARLATATNTLLTSLRQSNSHIAVLGTAGGVVEDTDVDDGLGVLSDWCASLGLARPDVPAEITDSDSGEALVYADAAWNDGMQVGMSEKVALVLERDEETEARLGELGYRFFTSDLALRHYVEELLNLDLDADGSIGDADVVAHSLAQEHAPGARPMTRDEMPPSFHPAEENAPDRPPFAWDPAALAAADESSREVDWSPSTGARTWYVNFGDERGRIWDDARRHGFISAGGGIWYSKPLHRIEPGDTLLVYLPGSGYVGIATATRRAVPFADAVVDGQDGPVRLASLDLVGQYLHNITNEDPAEYVVSVDWHVVVPKARAYKDPALFSNQATAVEMLPHTTRHALTVRSVHENLLT